MNKKIIIEVDHSLRDGEILQYKDGIVKSVDVHRLLPDLREAKKNISQMEEKMKLLENTVAELSKKVRELRGEDE